MRLWSINPKYLDRQGLLAVWREGLLAQSVLFKGEYIECNNCLGNKEEIIQGYRSGIKCSKCKGAGKIKTPYWNHSQLERFKIDDIGVIGFYLSVIGFEARNRGYNFNTDKIYKNVTSKKLTVTKRQLEYEFRHLQNKLYDRDKVTWQDNFDNIYVNHKQIEPHPLFKVIEGDIESWERIK
jgi:hypothetical protein